MNPVAIVKTIHWRPSGEKESVPAYREVVTFCPACEARHDFTIENLDARYKRSDGTPEPVWQWDGNLESPTFSPSMLAYSAYHICKNEHTYTETNPDKGGQWLWKKTNGELVPVMMGERKPPKAVRVIGESSPHPRDPAWGNCHSFLRNGVWDFLGDCAHPMANKQVPMVPLPKWVRG